MGGIKRDRLGLAVWIEHMAQVGRYFGVDDADLSDVSVFSSYGVWKAGRASM